jgi:hypothetical protein
VEEKKNIYQKFSACERKENPTQKLKNLTTKKKL